MHRDHGMVGSMAGLMDRLGDELFARTTFSQDEHCGIGRRHLFDHVEHPSHRRGFTYNVGRLKALAQLLLENNVFFFQPAQFKGPLDFFLQVIDQHAPFGQIVIRPFLDGLDSGFLRSKGRHQDAYRRLSQTFRPLDQFQTVFTRHSKIGEQHIKRIRFE